LKIGSYAFTFAVGDPKEGAMRASIVTEVDQPEKMQEIYRNMPQALSKLEGLPFKREVKVEKDAEKIRRANRRHRDGQAGVQRVARPARYAEKDDGGDVRSRWHGLSAVLLKGMVAQTMGAESRRWKSC
jgi:hypothetical protein